MISQSTVFDMTLSMKTQRLLQRCPGHRGYDSTLSGTSRVWGILIEQENLMCKKNCDTETIKIMCAAYEQARIEG